MWPPRRKKGGDVRGLRRPPEGHAARSARTAAILPDDRLLYAPSPPRNRRHALRTLRPRRSQSALLHQWSRSHRREDGDRRYSIRSREDLDWADRRRDLRRGLHRRYDQRAHPLVTGQATPAASGRCSLAEGGAGLAGASPSMLMMLSSIHACSPLSTCCATLYMATSSLP